MFFGRLRIHFSLYFPYRARHIGSFRSWRRRGCPRHHLAVESAVVLDFRGDFGVFNVLWRTKKSKTCVLNHFIIHLV